jgi:hypothetical protein
MFKDEESKKEYNVESYSFKVGKFYGKKDTIK